MGNLDKVIEARKWVSNGEEERPIISQHEREEDLNEQGVGIEIVRIKREEAYEAFSFICFP